MNEQHPENDPEDQSESEDSSNENSSSPLHAEFQHCKQRSENVAPSGQKV
ncbi:MAG: hypothetical protein JKY95_19790 [Planctomycetaceae bacterium]|nr:hypothetical protein [Planctomycetaceae bacterium]MBL4886755.1 hypothetical protein [Planctomycetaceae bacterium]